MQNLVSKGLLPLLLLLAGAVSATAQGQVRLERAVIAPGGGQASNAEMVATVTTEQPVAGNASNGQINGTFGFWNSAFVASSVDSRSAAGSISAVSVTPNPVVDRGSIVVALARAGQVTVDLYDATGSHVRTLHRGEHAAGQLNIELATAGLASGTYHVAVSMPGALLQQPVTVVR